MSDDDPYEVPEAQTDSGSRQDFSRKVDHMIADLTSRGYSAYTVAPPMYRLAWLAGWQLVPPLFTPFWKSAVFLGATWGILCGVGLTLLGAAGDQEMAEVVRFARSWGFLFGLPMAGYYRWLNSQLQLPAWQDYPRRPGHRPPRV